LSLQALHTSNPTYLVHGSYSLLYYLHLLLVDPPHYHPFSAMVLVDHHANNPSPNEPASLNIAARNPEINKLIYVV